jgi:hypothetical protein
VQNLHLYSSTDLSEEEEAMKSEQKHCTKCRHFKPKSEFYRNPRTTDGLSSYCKDCQKKAVKSWRVSNPKYFETLGYTKARIVSDLKRLEILRPLGKCSKCKIEKASYHFLFQKQTNAILITMFCKTCVRKDRPAFAKKNISIL